MQKTAFFCNPSCVINFPVTRNNAKIVKNSSKTVKNANLPNDAADVRSNTWVCPRGKPAQRTNTQYKRPVTESVDVKCFRPTISLQTGQLSTLLTELQKRRQRLQQLRTHNTKTKKGHRGPNSGKKRPCEAPPKGEKILGGFRRI